MRPYLRAANVTWDGLALADVKQMDFTLAESATYELRAGDLLLSEASGSPGEVGKPAQYRNEIEGCCFQNTLLRVRLPEGLGPTFYEHFFREQALNGRFAAGARGVGIHHLGAAALADWRIPVVPEAEQARIVAAIEEAFSKLDAGEAGLRSVRQRLKRMREAVLNAAVTGQLVPSVDSHWRNVRLAEVASWSSGGTPRSGVSAYYGGGIPWAVIGDLTEGAVSSTAATLTAQGLANSSAKLVQPGTVLIAMYGASIGRTGIAAIEMATNQAIACALPHEGVIAAAYLLLFLQSQRRAFVAQGQGAAQPNISQTLLKSWPLRVPPLEEQHRIVAEVERQLSFIAACERTVDAGLARAAALRRSILKAAFEGRLVPQDPSDEPASALLARIRAERSAAPASKRPGRRSK